MAEIRVLFALNTLRGKTATTTSGDDRHLSIQAGIVIHICDPNTEEEEAGRSQHGGQPGLTEVESEERSVSDVLALRVLENLTSIPRLL